MGEGGRPKRVSAYARDWADLRDPSSLKGDAMSLKAPLFTRLNKAYRKPTKHAGEKGKTASGGATGVLSAAVRNAAIAGRPDRSASAHGSLKDR